VFAAHLLKIARAAQTVIMRAVFRFFLSSAIAALVFTLFFAQPVYAQNTTNVTISSLKSGNGLSMPYGTICAYAVGIQGGAISISETGWGLVPAHTQLCGTVVNGTVPGGINVPDSLHSNLAAPINYNITIQQTDASGDPIGLPVQINNVAGVTGSTWALDQYAPPVTVPTPTPIVGYNASVPTTCVSPSIWTTPGGAAYACAGGAYTVITGGALPSGVTPDGASGLNIAGTATLGHDPTSNYQAATKQYVDTHAGVGAALVINASSLGCPSPGVDLTAGLMPNGATPTSATACLSAALASATPSSPVTLVLDSSYSGAIYGPAGGGWGIVAVHPSGIGRVPIKTWSCTGGSPNTCTFTTASGNNLAAGQYVNLGLFATTTAFNQQVVHVIATGLSSTAFKATSTAIATSGSATEAGEADYLSGDGLYAPQGLNNDVIHNGPALPAGLCDTGYSDPGWIHPGPAPSRGSGIWIKGIAINGNRGNGTVGNSTTGAPQGVGVYSTTYGSAYCSYMGINLNSMEHITLDGVTIYNTPAYMTRFTNDGDVSITNSTLNEVFPNGPPTSTVGGINGDGIHLSGQNDNFFISNVNLITTDDAIALNAAEGYVGKIENINIVDSMFHNSLTGLRAYTASVAPPAGDDIPLVQHVTISNYSGDATQSIALFGLLIGAGRTFTVPNSIDDITWSNSSVSGASAVFQVDDTIGRMRFDNIQIKDISCVNFSPAVFQNYYNTGMAIADLALTNVVQVYTSAHHCVTSLITDGGGAIAFGRLAVNGFRLLNESGSDVMPNLFNFTSGSTVQNYIASGVDLTNVAELMPPAQINQIHAYVGQQIFTNSHATIAQSVRSLVDVADGATTTECAYQLSPLDDTYNLSIERSCATGGFALPSQTAAYLQIHSPQGGSWSQLLFATSATANVLPPFQVSIGGGTCFGSAIAGYGCAPGDGFVWAANGFIEPLNTPASSTSNCQIGQYGDDANYHYVCTATNNWKRVALTAF
jgi:hypothetical protein